MDVKQVSSEYILLRESEEFLRRRISQGRKSFNPATGHTHNVPGPFFPEDDFQGIRDGHGVLVFNDPADTTNTSQHSSISGTKRIHTRDGVLTFNPESVVVTNDLEVWWITSPKWRRFIPLFCFFCFIIFLAHFIAAVTYLINGDNNDDIPDPYVCATPNCLRIGAWMQRSMNLEVKPCDDFYEYMCGKHREVEGELDGGKAPPELQMWMSSSAEFGDDILGKRRKESLRPFIDLLNLIGITSKTDDLTVIAARLSNYTGDFMFFDYWYRHGKAITVEPMKASLAQKIVDPLSTPDLVNLFLTISSAVTDVAKVVAYNGPVSDGTIAARSVQAICNCVLKIYEDCTKNDGKVFGKITDLDKELFDFYKSLLIAEEIGFSINDQTYAFAKPGDACFLDIDNGKLHSLPTCLRETFSFDTAQIKFSYRVLWILRVFISFVNDLDDITFQKILNPEKSVNYDSLLFSEAVEFRRSWIEAQCFKSLAANYGFLAFEAFAKDFGTRSASQKIQEFVRREQRILRKWVALGKFSHLTNEDQALLEKWTAPKEALNVLVNEKLYSFSELESTLRQWEPDPEHYFENVWTSRHLTEAEMTKDWFYKDTFTPWNTKVAIDLLLEVQTIPAAFGTTTDNKNFIYVPLTMLTFPFFQSDFRVLNFAGVASFVAREVVRLSFFTLHETPDKHGTEDPLTCECVVNDGKSQCTSSYGLHASENQPCFSDSRTNQFASALAIKLAFEAFRQRDQYRTLVEKDTGSTKIVEVNYRKEDGSPEYHTFEQKDSEMLKMEKVDTNRLRFGEAPDLRLAPKWLKGFEQFSQEQLFFMQFMRLHCYSPDSTYKQNVNEVIAQIQEFAAAWNCPADSNMVTTKPWFQM